MRTLTNVQRTVATRDITHVREKHPVRREIKWNANRQLDPSKHSSYPGAIEMQLRGNLNRDPCASCSKGAGPFADGCVSFRDTDAPENNGRVPFGGSCANCFWGGQGSRCTLRVGGRKYSSFESSYHS